MDRNIVRVEHKGVHLTVDRELVPGLQVQRGSLFQFIGEVTHAQVRTGPAGLTRRASQLISFIACYAVICLLIVRTAAATAAGACCAGCRRDGPRALRHGSGDSHTSLLTSLTSAPCF